MEQFVIKTQVYEWYGSENHVGDPQHGRYKPKGGEEFIFTATEADVFRERELIDLFNERYNNLDRWMRYEAQYISRYWSPVKAEIRDGEIIIC